VFEGLAGSPVLSRAVIVILLALHALLVIGTIRHNSLTCDEPVYIGAGRQYLETGNLRSTPLTLHPPLAYYVNSLLLLPVNFRADLLDIRNQPANVGTNLVFESGYDPDSLILLARLPILAVSVLLAALIYRWSKDSWGPAGALVSLFFYAFCPIVLAHAGLATIDIVFAATSTLFLYLFFGFLRKPSLINASYAGVALGLALLSKFTALILGPICLVCLVIHIVRLDRSDRWSTARQLGGLTLGIGVLAVLVIWAGYGFSCKVPDLLPGMESYPDRFFRQKPFWAAVRACNEHGVPVPLFPYVLGVHHQLHVSKIWTNNFLCGEISGGGWWYYYWFAFLVKTPISFLVCVFTASLATAGGRSGKLLGGAILTIAAIFSIPSPISIGVRYILPVYPLLCVYLGGVIWVLRTRLKSLLLALLCAWYLVSAVWSYPYYLAYFNELVGGPQNGYRYLVDSNLDWGQELETIAEYIRSNRPVNLKLKYLGPVEVMKYYGLRNTDLNDCSPAAGTWIVSATYLQGVALQNPGCHEWLQKIKPRTVLGHSVFVFDVEESDLAKLSGIQPSSPSGAANKTAEASP